MPGDRTDPFGYPEPGAVVRESVHAAVARLETELTEAAPGLAAGALKWTASLSHTGHPADYFLHPQAYPLLQLPRWLLERVDPPGREAFWADLVYAAVNGYYYLRLIDNIMDGEGRAEREILPAANFFHTNAQLPFQAYFQPSDPFWPDFRRWWYRFAEATWQDAVQPAIDRDTFERVTAMKTCPEKILLAAVCRHARHPDLIPPWTAFAGAFGCWHQMRDDVRDWIQDHRSGRPTYFLSEARRRMEPGESLPGWVLRTGFDWAVSEMEGWFNQLEAGARALDSRALNRYLERLGTAAGAQQDEIKRGFANLEALGQIFKD